MMLAGDGPLSRATSTARPAVLRFGAARRGLCVSSKEGSTARLKHEWFPRPYRSNCVRMRLSTKRARTVHVMKSPTTVMQTTETAVPIAIAEKEAKKVDLMGEVAYGRSCSASAEKAVKAKPVTRVACVLYELSRSRKNWSCLRCSSCSRNRRVFSRWSRSAPIISRERGTHWSERRHTLERGTHWSEACEGTRRRHTHQ